MNKLYNKLSYEAERAKLINKYDYDTMLDHFDRMNSIEKINKQKKSKISKINKNWEEKTRQIQLNEASKSFEKSLPEIKPETELSKLLREEINEGKSKIKNYNTIDYINLNQVKEEQKRIKLQISINLKLKKITDKNNLNKQKQKQKMNKKFGQDFFKFKHKLKELEEEKNIEVKRRENIEVDKFSIYLGQLENQKMRIEEKIKKEIMKFDKINENSEEIDRQNQERIKEKISRIFENREDEKIKFSNLRMKPLIEKIKINHSRFSDRTKVLEARRIRRDKYLLNKESKLMKKTNLKEKESAKHKSNLYEKILNDHQEFKMKCLQINSNVNVISSKNINSMTHTERKEYYKELRRKEDEEKKKLIEEKNKLTKY